MLSSHKTSLSLFSIRENAKDSHLILILDNKYKAITYEQ